MGARIASLTSTPHQLAHLFASHEGGSPPPLCQRRPKEDGTRLRELTPSSSARGGQDAISRSPNLGQFLTSHLYTMAK